MSTTETETTKADTLTFPCDVCQKPVADGQGYIWADAYEGTDKHRRKRTNGLPDERMKRTHPHTQTPVHKGRKPPRWPRPLQIFCRPMTANPNAENNPQGDSR